MFVNQSVLSCLTRGIERVADGRKMLGGVFSRSPRGLKGAPVSRAWSAVPPFPKIPSPPDAVHFFALFFVSPHGGHEDEHDDDDDDDDLFAAFQQ